MRKKNRVLPKAAPAMRGRKLPAKPYIQEAIENKIYHDAQFHYITEQKVRAWCVWGGEIDPTALSFDRSWPQITFSLREEYEQRAHYVADVYTNARTLGLGHVIIHQDHEHYEKLFAAVYADFYKDREVEVIRREIAMPYSTFKELLHARVGYLHESFDDGSGRLSTQGAPRVQPPEESDDSPTRKPSQLDRSSEPETLDDNDSSQGVEQSPDANNQEDKQEPEDDLTRLETAVAEGVQVLDRLYDLFAKDPSSWKAAGETDWLAEITRTKQYAEPMKVVIGVVGDTGAGKSSLINALVDEEKILPTNCMHASTAVTTEIAYNYRTASKYRAEIEFISHKAWEEELDALVRDLSDHSEGMMQNDHVFRHSEAAVAMNRTRAVYPTLSVEEIMDSSTEALLARGKISEFLGTTVEIENDDHGTFSKDLAVYIDSKGKKQASNGKTKSDVKGKAPMRTIFDNQTAPAIGFWPLLRVVRIYVKAKALSTGATLVDLPGAFDSNGARVAVAQGYMKKCSAHWVVTPISRAIDDKAAHDLLNQNLRLQLHMDGACNDLTFVCTKTDDISVSEVQGSLLQRDLPSPGSGDESQAKCVKLEQEVLPLNAKLSKIVSELDEIDERLERLEDSGDEAHGSPGKRKRDSLSPDKNTASIFERQSKIDGQIWALVERRRSLGWERKSILDELRPKKIEKANIEGEAEEQKINLVRECIQARNVHSKQELKRDFANGIHDLRNQGLLGIAESGGGEPHKPEELPVFCVSTRAYQKLEGRLRKEASVSGFKELEETEVPQLQEHCIAVTKHTREAFALRFLLHLRQLLNSISLWAPAGGGVSGISEQEKFDIGSRVYGAVEIFKREAKTALGGFMEAMCDIVTLNIIRNFEDASNQASIDCFDAIEKWNDLRFNTYRAICRRQGVLGDYNWNQDLANLVIKPLMQGWKNAFEVETPLELDWFAQLMKNYLQAFHVQAISSVDGLLSEVDEGNLQNTWTKQGETLEKEVKLTIRVIRKVQREINRGFAGAIEKQLNPAYVRCATESGPGTVQRTGEHMKTHAITTGLDMFADSTGRVRRELVNLLHLVERVLAAVVERAVEQTCRDYTHCIITPLVQRFTSSQLRVKKEVAEATYAAEKELGLENLLESEEEGFHQEGSGGLRGLHGSQPQKRVLESIQEEDEE